MADKYWICINCGAQNPVTQSDCVVCENPSPLIAHEDIPVVFRTNPSFRLGTWCVRFYFMIILGYAITVWSRNYLIYNSLNIPETLKNSLGYLWEAFKYVVLNISNSFGTIEMGWFRFIFSYVYDTLKELVEFYACPGYLLQVNLFIYLLLSLVWILRVCIRKHNCLQDGQGSIIPLLFEVPVLLIFLSWLQINWESNTADQYFVWQFIMAEMSLFAGAASLIIFLVLSVWKITSNSSVKSNELIGSFILTLMQLLTVYGMRMMSI